MKQGVKTFFSRKGVIVIVIVVIAFAAFFLSEAYYLNIAHSTFQNYYNFRGCVQLLEKTDTYGTCKLASGQTIKIVLYNGKWYLDGDLPYAGFNFL